MLTSGAASICEYDDGISHRCHVQLQRDAARHSHGSEHFDHRQRFCAHISPSSTTRHNESSTPPCACQTQQLSQRCCLASCATPHSLTAPNRFRLVTASWTPLTLLSSQSQSQGGLPQNGKIETEKCSAASTVSVLPLASFF